MKKQAIEYRDGDVLLEGFCAFDDSITTKRPAVLVCHDWSGKNEFAVKKAEQLAELGYVSFALDVFGKGIRGATKEEKSALIQPFMQDRMKLQKRLLAAFETVKGIAEVDVSRIGVIGFCFGGLCALDLARSGADIKGAVSFHGLLLPAQNIGSHVIKAKVLALHGFDDPMVTHADVIAFGQEMTRAKVDWEIDMYGHAVHAFTNPLANDHAFGTVYEKHADARSWIAMENFFAEVF